MPYKSKEDKVKWEAINRDRLTIKKSQYFDECPWLKALRNIRARCLNKTHHYFKKGIRNFLNSKDIHFLWLRDKAYELTRPSVDRINPDGDYCLENCRFIELEENLKRRYAQCRTI